MDQSRFAGRLALQQRVLAAYRAPLFDGLAQACVGGMSVCAGRPRPEELIAVIDRLKVAEFVPVENKHILRGSLYFCYQSGLLRWLEECSPDVLIVEANPRYLSTPAAIRWMKQRERPVLGWGLGAPASSGLLSRLRRNRRESFLHSFDGLLTYSQRGAVEYASLGFPPDKIFVAPNAATPAPSQPPPIRAAGFDGKPNLLFVGRLQKRKRVDLLLQACAALPIELQPNLVIVGDGPERPHLEELAKSVYPTTEFPGAKLGDELAAYFRAADLFALPGTGGLAAQEAMSYALPIIMGQGDGTNDALVRAGNGWQIPSDDLAALMDALGTALADPGRLRQMGRESYRIVAEEINLDRMVGVFVKALNTVKKQTGA